jgi:putative hydrolase of the HAD superfamily
MNEKRQINLVVFDLGNVVLQLDFDAPFRIWANCSGVPVAALRERFAIDEAFKEFERGNMPARDYCTHICELMGMSLSYDEFTIGWNAIFDGVFSDVVEHCREMKNTVGMVALTNTNAVHLESFREQHGELFDFFDEIYCSSTIGMRKPDLESYRYVLDARCSAACETLFFDDNADNVAAARELGIDAVQVVDPADIARILSDRGLLGRT